MLTTFAGPICTGWGCGGLLSLLFIFVFGILIFGILLLPLGIYLVFGKKRPKTAEANQTQATNEIDLMSLRDANHEQIVVPIANHISKTRKTIGSCIIIIAVIMLIVGILQVQSIYHERRQSEKSLQAYTQNKEAEDNKRDQFRLAFKDSDIVIYDVADTSSDNSTVAITSVGAGAIATTRYTTNRDPKTQVAFQFTFYHLLDTGNDSTALLNSGLNLANNSGKYNGGCAQEPCSLIAKNDQYVIKRVTGIKAPNNLYEVTMGDQVILVSVDAGTSSEAARNVELSKLSDKQIVTIVSQLTPIDKNKVKFSVFLEE